jgi:hypothetical protein
LLEIDEARSQGAMIARAGGLQPLQKGTLKEGWPERPPSAWPTSEYQNLKFANQAWEQCFQPLLKRITDS